MKTGQLIEQLKNNLKKENDQILQRLEKSLIKEWKEMQRRIEKNTQSQNQKILKEMKESLENIDWELEQCRTLKKWKWAMGGMILGAILTIIAFRIVMKG